MKYFLDKFIIAMISGGVTALTFLLVSYAAVPGTPGEVGVPGVGYIHDILSNKLLVNNNYITTNGQVRNSLFLDGYSGSEFQRRVTGTCPLGEWAIGVNLDNSIKCSSTGGTAAYDCVSLGATNAIGNNGCDWVFANVGLTNWIVPPGITQISVVAIGGGAAATNGVGSNAGGGGGALAWKNNINVTPGQTIAILVGTGGIANGQPGFSSSILGMNAGGGGGWPNAAPFYSAGGSPTGHQGGGRGGNGGVPSGWGAGGGGAGGYTGNGGNGGNGNAVGTNGSNGNGGGGGGGYGGANPGGGGGTGIFGIGASGNGGNNGTPGGKKGSNGIDGSLFVPGNYGGGGASLNLMTQSGASGVVRIIWGPGRTFPNSAQ